MQMLSQIPKLSVELEDPPRNLPESRFEFPGQNFLASLCGTRLDSRAKLTPILAILPLVIQEVFPAVLLEANEGTPQKITMGILKQPPKNSRQQAVT